MSCGSLGQPTVVGGTAGMAVRPEYQEAVFRDCDVLTPGPCQPVDVTIGVAGIRSSRQQQERRPFSHDGRLPVPGKRLHGPAGVGFKETVVAVPQDGADLIDRAEQDRFHAAILEPLVRRQQCRDGRHLELADCQTRPTQLQYNAQV